MTSQEYIENGIVLDYCLGLISGNEKSAFEQALKQFPDLYKEYEAVQAGLEKYVSVYSASPPARTKEKVLGALENLFLEKQMDLSNLPLINKFSDPKAWLSAITPLLPTTLDGGRFSQVLTQTDHLTQVLIMSATDIEDEVHEDVIESFIILQGECECYIGSNRVVKLRAGGYLEIPLHEHHDVKIVSDYVIGIMQRVAA